MPQEPEEKRDSTPEQPGGDVTDETAPGGPAASLQGGDDVFEDDPGGEGDGPNRNRVG